MATLAPQATYLGEDISYVIAVPATSAPSGIGGWSFTFRFLAADNVTVLFSKTVGSGITITTAGPPGLVTIILPSSDTAGLAPGEYNYAIFRSDSGLRSMLTYGPWLLSEPLAV